MTDETAEKPTHRAARMLPKTFRLTWKQTAEMVVKNYGIHEGHWYVYVRFGDLQTMNANITGKVWPYAMVPVVELGLARCNEPMDLSVDAAEVNPAKTVSLN